MAAFFSQTILEHRLSRYATRMIAMYQATESAKERRKELEREQKKLTRQLLNKKQIEMFSGLQLWT
jgi:F0F1-type ATP synthase gamma subunit